MTTLHPVPPLPPTPISDDFVIHTDPTLHTLVQMSALAGCTTTVREGSHWRVTKRWPGLSTGEAILWDCLSALAVRNAPSDDLLERARAHLDVGNLSALLTALDALGVPA
jgi:hypothetical protein